MAQRFYIYESSETQPYSLFVGLITKAPTKRSYKLQWEKCEIKNTLGIEDIENIFFKGVLFFIFIMACLKWK